jgi:hypothetical protein
VVLVNWREVRAYVHHLPRSSFVFHYHHIPTTRTPLNTPLIRANEPSSLSRIQNPATPPIRRKSTPPPPQAPPPSHHTMTSSASKRLFKEYRGLSSDPPDGLTAGPITEDDLFLWEALIQGPEGTPFEGGVFPAELKFPKDYPLAPPKMTFLVDVWHPNGTY